jgi:hypothetical protein
MIELSGNVLTIGGFGTRIPPMTRSTAEATYVEESFDWQGRTLRLRTWRMYDSTHTTCKGLLLEPKDGRGITIGAGQGLMLPDGFKGETVMAGFWRGDIAADNAPPEVLGASSPFANPLTASEVLDYLWWLDSDPHYFDNAGASDEP